MAQDEDRLFDILLWRDAEHRHTWLKEKVDPTEAPVTASSLVVEHDDGKFTDPVEDFSFPRPSMRLSCSSTARRWKK